MAGLWAWSRAATAPRSAPGRSRIASCGAASGSAARTRRGRTYATRPSSSSARTIPTTRKRASRPEGIWTASVAPFRLGLINLRPADDKCRVAADDLYAKLRNAGLEVLYDDRDDSPGAKFAAMDLVGLPDQLIIGPRGLAAGNIEWKHRRDGARQDLPLDTAVGRFAA